MTTKKNCDIIFGYEKNTIEVWLSLIERYAREQVVVPPSPLQKNEEMRSKSEKTRALHLYPIGQNGV